MSTPPRKRTTKAPEKRSPGNEPPTLLSGGNPQIGKADGDAPVQAYIAATQGWKHGVVRHIDTLITRLVPDVRKAVRWNESDTIDEALWEGWVRQAVKLKGAPLF